MILYIYSQESKEFVEKNKGLDVWSSNTQYLPFEELDSLDISTVSHFLVTGFVKEIKKVLHLAYSNNISLGIIPMPEQKELMRTLSLPNKTSEAITLALSKSEKKVDLLFCNETIVLQEVVIGDAPPLDHFDTVLQGKTFFDRVKLFLMTIKKIKTLTHTEMKVTSAKENEMTISAVGVVAVEYNNSTFAAKLLSSKLNAGDGKLLIVILSPRSILQYVGYLFQSLVSYVTPKKLPSSLGYISSSEVTIEPKKDLRIRIDSTESENAPIHLKVEKEVLALSVGDEFWEKQSNIKNTKESFKIDHLPSDEESSLYLGKKIPLFTHASQEQYFNLFTNLREEGKVNSVYITLLILSTMIATFGLFINSSSVVIGAMLLAPLMQPIVSLSMGALRQDETLEVNSAKSIFWGVLAVLITSSFIAYLLPIDRLTSEMSGRLSPTTLDLLVAIVSGISAAYVKSNENILSSLAGVAIAVALVPPLAVAGIGLGWADWHMFIMAFLLFITNLVGIVFAAAFTFLVLGFAPLKVAMRGIFMWLVIVAVVALPLYSSFKQMQTDIHVQKTLSNLTIKLDEHRVKLTHVKLIHRPDMDEIRCEVISSGILSEEEKSVLKEKIVKSIDKEAEIIVTFRYKL
ncbi:putative integral membrane protein [hydrothermal vent metagenome]|uniref:Putative integral membrane protein n=1 Tax=hydrothermal vent metagenome TaxID=652676 RepID=A0A1W1EEC7_9ZZZZ